MKTAIITGSSRGIGFAIANELHSMGYHVIVNSSSYRKETEETFIKSFGKDHTYVYGDIKKSETWDKLIDAAKAHSRLDILVNNAGIAPPVREDILVSKQENFDIVMDTNLKATYFMTQKAANYMIETLNSFQDYLPRIIKTWKNTDYNPKMHFSSP